MSGTRTMSATLATNPFHAAIEKYARAPIAFVRDILGVEPDPWQLEALRAVARGHTRLAIRSGHGVGKTCFRRVAVRMRFICTRAPFKVAITAPSSSQLFDALWPEFIKWLNILPSGWRDLWDIRSDRVTLKADQECFLSPREHRGPIRQRRWRSCTALISFSWPMKHRVFPKRFSRPRRARCRRMAR